MRKKLYLYKCLLFQLNDLSNYLTIFLASVQKFELLNDIKENYKQMQDYLDKHVRRS